MPVPPAQGCSEWLAWRIQACLAQHESNEPIEAHFLEDNVRDNQSKPSYKPSPVVAQADWMNHWRWRKLWRPSFSVTSAAAMALGKSCLLAKTRSTASRISSSSSSFA